MINAALLSYGMSGEIFHAPLIHNHPKFRLKSIVERRSERSRSQYPDVNIARTVNEIAQDPEIEVAVVNTPNPTHYEFAKLMLEAGKHVVVEKPFTNTVSEANDLIALAKKKGKILTVFQNRRWDGDFMTVKKVVEQKLLGDLVEYEAYYDRYRPVVEMSWKEAEEPGSGTIYNLGSHMIDQALVLFGRPLTVTADMRIQREGAKVHDNYEAILDYGKLKVTLKSSYLAREAGPRYILHGTKGSFVKYGIDPQEQALKDGGVPRSARWGKEKQEDWGILNTQIGDLRYYGRIETIAGDYSAFYDNLYAAIREGAALAVKPEEAALCIETITAALESSAKKQTITMKPGA